jgi:hypothetical protein
VDAPKQSVAGLFGRAAADYDRVGFFHQVAPQLLALAGVSHGMRVLDVACGAGAVLVPASRLVGPAGLAVGIDVAEPMAAVAASTDRVTAWTRTNGYFTPRRSAQRRPHTPSIARTTRRPRCAGRSSLRPARGCSTSAPEPAS